MENPRIAVIDVETPNSHNDSICSIGITVIEENRIVNQLYYLINPETEFGNRQIQIHHITAQDVIDKPKFPEIWRKINTYFSNYLLAGHNLRFDLSCIKKTLFRYKIEANPIYFVDTFDIAKDVLDRKSGLKLTALCDYYGIDLENHHNALDDSTATANLLLIFNCLLGVDIDNYIIKYSLDYSEKGTKKRRSNKTDTKYLQELQGLLYGATCDGKLSDEEIIGIRQWTLEHEYLRGNYPFDKIYSSIERVLEDYIITKEERNYLFSLFNIILDPVEKQNTSCDVIVENKTICLTGDFECMSKSELAEELANKGAIIKKDVTKNLDYLIVGSKGSERWAHGNYGTKVKKALEYNEKACNIKIIKEDDFIKCLIDE